MGEKSNFKMEGVVLKDAQTRPIDTMDAIETLKDIETYLKKTFDPESLQGQIIMSLFETTQHCAYDMGWNAGFKSPAKD